MEKSKWQWFITNRVAAVVVISTAFAASLALFLALVPGYWPGGIALSYEHSWRGFLAILPATMILAAPIVGLLRCGRKEDLSLEAWWSGVREMVVPATVVVWIAWVDITLAQNSPHLHATWVASVETLGRLLKPVWTILASAGIAIAAWYIAFHVIIPTIRAFNEARRG